MWGEVPPDPDWAHLLFGLLLTADLMIIFGSAVTVLLAVALAAVIVGAVLGARGCASTIFGLSLSLLGMIFGPVVALLTRTFRRNQRGVPLLRFRIYDSRTRRHRDCQIKGHLHGSIEQGDQVRVWGTERNGVVHFRRGENLSTGAVLTLPPRLSVFLLIGLVALNVAALIYISTHP